jgi:GWxTD domain-containing protein
MNILKAIFIFILFIILPSAYAQKINALFSYATFYNPEKGPYIETYLSIDGSSVKYIKNENDNWQATVLVTLIFKQGEKIITFKKYDLTSPELASDTSLKINFLDIQRIPLANGNYEMSLVLADKNLELPDVEVSQPIEISYPKDIPVFSDVEFFERMKKNENKNMLTKSGFDIYPYLSNYFPEDVNALGFYVELYNINKTLSDNEPFLVTYEIIENQSKNTIKNFKAFKKMQASNVNIITGMFDIKDLPTGNYLLHFEAKNKNNELLAVKDAFFQRKNTLPVLNIDETSIAGTFVENMSEQEISEYIKALAPISTEMEMIFAENQLKNNNNPELKKQYFYHFWLSRNSQNPQEAWEKYKKDLAVVEQEYGTQIKRGYETDRGRVYLKYGPPNSVMARRNEPSAYPYEIWHYYKIGQFTNRKFVFYNPDLVTNDYQLIHSNVFGEVNYPQWKVLIHRRTTQSQDIDLDQQQDHYGGNIDEYYDLPR